MSEVPLYPAWHTKMCLPPWPCSGTKQPGLQNQQPVSSSPRALCSGGLDPRNLKTALFCISFLRKGVVLAYLRRIHNLKNLKRWAEGHWESSTKVTRGRCVAELGALHTSMGSLAKDLGSARANSDLTPRRFTLPSI